MNIACGEINRIYEHVGRKYNIPSICDYSITNINNIERGVLYAISVSNNKTMKMDRINVEDKTHRD